MESISILKSMCKLKKLIYFPSILPTPSIPTKVLYQHLPFPLLLKAVHLIPFYVQLLAPSSFLVKLLCFSGDFCSWQHASGLHLPASLRAP